MVAHRIRRLETHTVAILLILLAALTGFGFAATNGFLQSNSSDLVAHYRFDEGGRR